MISLQRAVQQPRLADDGLDQAHTRLEWRLFARDDGISPRSPLPVVYSGFDRARGTRHAATSQSCSRTPSVVCYILNVNVDRAYLHPDHILDGSRNGLLDRSADTTHTHIRLDDDVHIHPHRTVGDGDLHAAPTCDAAKEPI
jgi:hypothetical protein